MASFLNFIVHSVYPVSVLYMGFFDKFSDSRVHSLLEAFFVVVLLMFVMLIMVLLVLLVLFSSVVVVLSLFVQAWISFVSFRIFDLSFQKPLPGTVVPQYDLLL